MKKINFKALPDRSTPVGPANLNTMQNNIEESAVVVSAIEPQTSEKVWFQAGKNKKIYTKNNGVFEEFYSEENLTRKGYAHLSTEGEFTFNEEQKVQNWGGNSFDMNGFTADTANGRIIVPKGVEMIEISGSIAGHNNCIVFYKVSSLETGQQISDNQQASILNQPSGNGYFNMPLKTSIIRLNKNESHKVELYCNGYKSIFELNAGFGVDTTYIDVKQLI